MLHCDTLLHVTSKPLHPVPIGGCACGGWGHYRSFMTICTKDGQRTSQSSPQAFSVEVHLLGVFETGRRTAGRLL